IIKAPKGCHQMSHHSTEKRQDRVCGSFSLNSTRTRYRAGLINFLLCSSKRIVFHHADTSGARFKNSCEKSENIKEYVQLNSHEERREETKSGGCS
ncbi:uncharacterized, partial [Tachysurus ichikawai]